MQHPANFSKHPAFQRLQDEVFEKIFQYYQSGLTTSKRWKDLRLAAYKLGNKILFMVSWEKAVLLYQLEWMINQKFFEWRLKNIYQTKIEVFHHWIWTENGFFEAFFRTRERGSISGTNTAREWELHSFSAYEFDGESFRDWNLYFPG